MSRKEQVRDYVGRAEFALRERGTYSMFNDEPGLAHEVFEELRKMYPKAELALEKPSFGGEATFTSSNRLGFRA